MLVICSEPTKVRVMNADLGQIFESGDAAIIFQQLHYRLEKAQGIVCNGYHWVWDDYKTLAGEQFTWIKPHQIRKIINFLRGLGLIIVNRLNKYSWNHENHYTIDYERLDEILIEHGFPPTNYRPKWWNPNIPKPLDERVAKQKGIQLKFNKEGLAKNKKYGESQQKDSKPKPKPKKSNSQFVGYIEEILNALNTKRDSKNKKKPQNETNEYFDLDKNSEKAESIEIADVSYFSNQDLQIVNHGLNLADDLYTYRPLQKNSFIDNPHPPTQIWEGEKKQNPLNQDQCNKQEVEKCQDKFKKVNKVAKKVSTEDKCSASLPRKARKRPVEKPVLTKKFDVYGNELTEEKLARFYAALVIALPLVANSYSPEGLARTIVAQVRRGEAHSYWDDFLAGDPIGTRTKQEWFAAPGVPYPLFKQYLESQLAAPHDTNEQKLKKALDVLAKPQQALNFWKEFCRTIQLRATDVRKAKELGVSVPAAPPWMNEKEYPTIEQAAAAMNIILNEAVTGDRAIEESKEVLSDVLPPAPPTEKKSSLSGLKSPSKRLSSSDESDIDKPKSKLSEPLLSPTTDLKSDSSLQQSPSEKQQSPSTEKKSSLSGRKSPSKRLSSSDESKIDKPKPKPSEPLLSPTTDLKSDSSLQQSAPEKQQSPLKSDSKNIALPNEDVSVSDPWLDSLEPELSTTSKEQSSPYSVKQTSSKYTTESNAEDITFPDPWFEEENFEFSKNPRTAAIQKRILKTKEFLRVNELLEKLNGLLKNKRTRKLAIKSPEFAQIWIDDRFEIITDELGQLIRVERKPEQPT